MTIFTRRALSSRIAEALAAALNPEACSLAEVEVWALAEPLLEISRAHAVDRDPAKPGDWVLVLDTEQLVVPSGGALLPEYVTGEVERYGLTADVELRLTDGTVGTYAVRLLD